MTSRPHAPLFAVSAVLALLVGVTTMAVPGSTAAGSTATARAHAAAATSSTAQRRAQADVRLRLAGMVSDQASPVARVRVTSARRLPAGVVVIRTQKRILAKVATRPRRAVKVRVALPKLPVGEHRVRAVFKSKGRRASSKLLILTSRSGCAWRPSSCGYADARNTGTSGHLQRVPEDVSSGPGWHYDDRGWVQIDGKGAVFEGYRLSAGIDITASNVTVRNNVVRAPLDWPIALRHADGLVIAGNSLGGTAPDRICDNAIRDIYGDSDDVRITGNDISWCSSGLNHFNRGGVIRRNYIHDLGYECSDDPDCGHFNGIQLGAGLGPRMTIERNTIFLPYDATDAIMLANDDGPQANRVIRDNLLAGGGYTFYGSGGPDGEATDIVFTGNRFSTLYFSGGGYWGPVAHWQQAAGNVWEGNVWDDGPRAGQEVRP